MFDKDTRMRYKPAMNTTLLFPLSGLLTLFSAYLVWRQIGNPNNASETPYAPWVVHSQSLAIIISIIGITFLHPIQAQYIHFNLIEAAATATLLVQLMYLFGVIRHGVQGLGLFLLPAMAVPLILAPFLPIDTTTQPILTSSILETTHLLISMIAYAMLTMAAFHAVMLLLLDQALKRKHMHPIIQAMPPLTTLEAMMMSMVRWSVWLILLSILTGLVWQWVDFSNMAIFNHKVLLACFSFAMLFWLMHKQRQGVWHAQRTSQWLLTAYALMLLAYFGVHLIKAWVA